MAKEQLPPLWTKVKELYNEGASDVEVMKLLEITKPRFTQMMRDSDAFREFVELGRVLQEAWWHEQSRKGVWSKEFNSSVFNFVMKNRYGWAEKIQNTADLPAKNMSQDELQTHLSKMFDEYAKHFGNGPKTMSDLMKKQ
jgi:hypothetical protein